MRQKLDWLDMLSRRICHSLTILFKILKYKQPVYLSDMFTLNSEINNRLTRTYEGNIWIGNAHYSVIHRKAFRIYISRVWNSLPTEAKLCNTVNTFKNHIKKLFMSNSFQVPITWWVMSLPILHVLTNLTIWGSFGGVLTVPHSNLWLNDCPVILLVSMSILIS